MTTNTDGIRPFVCSGGVLPRARQSHLWNVAVDWPAKTQGALPAQWKAAPDLSFLRAKARPARASELR